MRLLDVLLPQRCLGCEASGALLCARCLAGLHRLDGPLCARCGAPTAWPVARCRECAGRRIPFSEARAAVAYDATVARLVRGWKEGALRGIGPLAAGIVAETVSPPQVSAVAWVPPDRDRLLRRGHSTAEQLARLLSRRWGLEPLPLVERTRYVSPQRGLERADRRRNVAAAFRARAAPSRVCLVDDVYTTGATVAAAATELRRAGARRVTVVTFARTLRSLD